jgi:hypothetical protein
MIRFPSFFLAEEYQNCQKTSHRLHFPVYQLDTQIFHEESSYQYAHALPHQGSVNNVQLGIGTKHVNPS